LAYLHDASLIALDAKISIDPSALYRQKEILKIIEKEDKINALNNSINNNQ